MYKLLAVGPLPPPFTGTPVSFEIFCENAKTSPIIDNLVIVDSSPKYLKQQKRFQFSLRNIKQAISIIYEFSKYIRRVDSAIVFGSNGYIISLAPILLIIARINNKRCYFRVFGGSLDQYISNLNWATNWIAETTLRRFTGLIVQTRYLRDHFSNLVESRSVHYVPGYRQPLRKIEIISEPDKDTCLKIVFVGIVKEDKGIFVLLDAMQNLSRMEIDVELVIYGSIHEPIRARFEKLTHSLNNTKYEGVLHWREVVTTLAKQDLLVLPTFYHSEGHPGVLIEAMMAGIPILSTHFRSIPELVSHGHNGLLVSPRNAVELADAIKNLAIDRDLLKKLGDNNALMSQNFAAEVLVSEIIEIATAQRDS